jgi:hypothetical protein
MRYLQNKIVIKTIATLCGALLSLGLAGVPAHAGQGASQLCNDGIGPGTEIPIVSTPVTLHLEISATSPAYLQVCYSTTSVGSTAPTVTGGEIAVYDITGNAWVFCAPDNTTVLAVSCDRLDANPASPGYKLSFGIRAQETVVNVDLGAEVGQLGAPACLRGLTVWVAAGQLGPFNVGVC